MGSTMHFHFEVDTNGDGQKRQTTIAKNILRYLPVLPRIQRLFMTEDTAQQMRWAVEGNRYTDKMIHPSDGSAWKNFVKKYPLGVCQIEPGVFITRGRSMFTNAICRLCAKSMDINVTAQNWYPKIRAKFSLFALYCIMAYLFKLFKLNKATHGKLKQRKQTLPRIPKPNALLSLATQNILELTYLSRKFQECIS